MSSAKRTAALALALALAGTAIPGAALAQSQQGTGQQGVAPGTTGGATLRELDDDRTDITWNGMTLDDLEDMDVHDAAGERIGDVEEILGDAGDNVVAFVVEAGGFLGIGDEELVVPADRLRPSDNGKSLVVDMSPEEMRALERWDD